ncbi:hypothetical protein NX794_33125 [Streptomyces sp. LP11]|uniref:Uncharacterized protein n=1 Tax=Streptomyces pyxinicus TaxID=2970331 RepID=A0ABT2BD82_9ACTN|nr:hypothetical protein [Streptomyces sp. LP11]MCS0606015.1 hypothetical protein [Streptomyces sp. LP11]
MPLEPRPDEAPPLIEALAVWGWAVEHGGIPARYAAIILADHPCFLSRWDTRAERYYQARKHLADWENVVVYMDWPGDQAIEEERWDQDAYWWLRERALRGLGLVESDETTEQLTHRYLQEQIAECERLAAKQDPRRIRPTDEGTDR